MPTALVFLAEGAEEMEVVITVDVLRRGDFKVTLAGLSGNGPVKCNKGVQLVPDKSLKDALASGPYDVMVVPGGLKGSENLAASSEVGKALKEQEQRGGYIAAICAGPTVFLKHGAAKGKKITSYPSFADKLRGAYDYQESNVAVDGKVITSRGPGTCFQFALAIIEAIQGKEKAHSLESPMLIKT